MQNNNRYLKPKTCSETVENNLMHGYRSVKFSLATALLMMNLHISKSYCNLLDNSLIEHFFKKKTCLLNAQLESSCNGRHSHQLINYIISITLHGFEDIIQTDPKQQQYLSCNNKKVGDRVGIRYLISFFLFFFFGNWNLRIWQWPVVNHQILCFV